MRRNLVTALMTLIAAATCAAVATAGTSGGGPIALHGKQVAVDEATGKYELTGSLLGEFLVETFVESYKGKDGVLVASGKERFRGCHDLDGDGVCGGAEPSGTLRFTYLYWAKFTSAGALVRGECMHPIVGGTGGFAKATGFVHMWDKPRGENVVTTYVGSIQYPKAVTTSSRTAGRGLAAAAARGCRPS